MKHIEHLRAEGVTSFILHHCCICGYPVTVNIASDPAILDEGCYCVIERVKEGKSLREVPLKTIEDSIVADPTLLDDAKKGIPQ